ncbi:MAG: hypothetical protein VXZ72_00605 [Chlamydiota bacterium]|nr:hypothetical protein [Chlamydiota bacterium]
MEWISHTLLPVEESEFHHWRSIKGLYKMVCMAEQGLYPKYAALNAIQQYNDTHNTHVEYEEILELDSTYVPCGAGEWLAWVDDQSSLLMGDYDEPMDAFMYCDCTWVILQLDGELHVMQSPYQGDRDYDEDIDDSTYINGTRKGPYRAFVLPPEIEAGIIQDVNPNMPETVYIKQKQENHYANGWISNA